MSHSFKISGLKLIQTQTFSDARGFFKEQYQHERYESLGLPPFLQDNHSRSKPGVLRGLHFQKHPHPQGKLVSVIRGQIWDVAVDLRKNSPTFGQYEAIELSDKNGLQLWIPPGFAHGFCVLSDEMADVIYKVDSLYSSKDEGGIAYNDPTLGIQWPVKNPVLSERDQSLPRLTPDVISQIIF